PSNRTYEYFVDWGKVKNVVSKYINELSLLNSLTKVDSSKREDYLRSLLEKYPKLAEVIPLLIAVRAKNKKINIFDLETEGLLTFEFESSKINNNTIPQIIDFCTKTGVMNLFQEARDIYDYFLGIEVGIDTNARKNRSGDIFEKMCQKKIEELLNNGVNEGYTLINNDPNFSLYSTVTGGKSKGKIHDFVIYKNDRPILIIECNFYNVAGSKPPSIAESYIEMDNEAKRKKVEFVWVTDGPGWHEMKESLIRSIEKIEWVLNYKMLSYMVKILQ
ncbi:MAG TPA: hypothetical protein EYP16_00755, partial [Candidatus Atribacteria bacterium]|nr:hypothetical protein [Candidatus Atribacteria bacterium]